MRSVALMPAGQGAGRWPSDTRCRSALVREDDLPLADGSVERVLLVHALECCTNLPRLMREIWRVLADGGRVVAIVPNRRGLWSLSDRTPFGHGQPYSSGQLERMLKEHLFAPCAERSALFLPPTESRLLLRLTIPAERIGLTLARRFAGVRADRGRKADLCRYRCASPRDGPAPALRADPRWPRRGPNQPVGYRPRPETLQQDGAWLPRNKAECLRNAHCRGCFRCIAARERRVISSVCQHVAGMRLAGLPHCSMTAAAIGTGAPSRGATDVRLHADIHRLPRWPG